MLRPILYGFAVVAAAAARPNIVFLVVESTDGRTWQEGYQNSVIPLPNIHMLQEHGVSFYRHYSNTPVCCPSRATFWSGRHAHKIPHLHNNISVGGAWNNYEGLPQDFSHRIDQELATKAHYNTLISGKEDWVSGGHSLNVRLNSWTMYSQFPYSVNESGGWHDETGDCASQGTVTSGNSSDPNDSAHQGDWDTLKRTTNFIREYKKEQPFFVYQGMNIVHPPYVTNQFYYDKINASKIVVPDWKPLAQLHACDLQSSMLKGCTPSNANQQSFYSTERRRNIRRIYYSMIAEFDAMVGAYISAVKEAGLWNSTVFIVTSDHGDMQMEHQQHYKMVPYDASASVPMVIYDGRHSLAAGKVVTNTTQLIDIFPTVMDLAGIPINPSLNLDGHSLVPFLQHEPVAEARPPYVVSQFHGCNIAMSWFMIVQTFGSATFKYIVYGNGTHGEVGVPNQLFELSKDPNEKINLSHETAFNGIRVEMEQNLRKVVDYAKVAQEVAQYGKDSFAWWANNTDNWQSAIHAKDLRWTQSWDQNAAASMDALQKWMQAPAEIVPCRSSLQWPSNN